MIKQLNILKLFRSSKIKEWRGLIIFAFFLFAGRSAIADWNAKERLPEKTHAVMGLPAMPALRSFGPIKVPAGQFLMLGDSRDNSGDSRYFGLVPRKQIAGRAERVIISWDSENYYKPRFKRFFQPLI